MICRGSFQGTFKGSIGIPLRVPLRVVWHGLLCFGFKGFGFRVLALRVEQGCSSRVLGISFRVCGLGLGFIGFRVLALRVVWHRAFKVFRYSVCTMFTGHSSLIEFARV